MADIGIQNLGLFILAGWALNLTPGPDVFYMVGSTLRRGLRGGVIAMAGIFTGCLVHVFAATVGLSALIATSSTAFTLLKWLGAAYLIYIGLQMVRTKLPAAETQPLDVAYSQSISNRTIFIQGFLSNALNPKVALFFLAFLPQFISANTTQPWVAFLALGILFNVNAIPVNLGYVALAAWVSKRMGSLRRGMVWLERAAGALFIGFGVKLALSER
jgi:RhtB (resistance to homoserine/threonine) family protein